MRGAAARETDRLRKLERLLQGGGKTATATTDCAEILAGANPLASAEQIPEMTNLLSGQSQDDDPIGGFDEEGDAVYDDAESAAAAVLVRARHDADAIVEVLTARASSAPAVKESHADPVQSIESTCTVVAGRRTSLTRDGVRGCGVSVWRHAPARHPT